MGLRYCIRPATSVDVAFLASVMDESRDPWNDGEEVAIDRLLQTCACSAQIWAARDTAGTPTALWGVAPMADDPEVGHLWMLACEAFDNEPEELQELSRLVFGEMLDQFPRLENIIDSRKVRIIELLRAVGFAVEPALPPADAGRRLVWIDSDRLHCGGRAGLLPN
ncbi:MAG TPA: hypothetical protein VI232_00850 [Reyranella sp.]|jgi:hypothetical protein